MTTCAQCSEDFAAARSDAAYCSSACRQRAYRNRNTIRNGRRVTDTNRPSTIRNARCVTDTVVIDWDSLPGPVKQKEERMRRQIRREVERDFEPRVQTEVTARLEHVVKDIQHLKDMYRIISESRLGVFDKTEFNTIRSCLHPDSRLSVSEGKLDKAFRLFSEAEVALLKSQDRPKPPSSLPTSVNDLNWKKRGTRR